MSAGKGCVCTIVPVSAYREKIVYCSMHAAAPELLMALKQTVMEIKNHDDAPYQCESVEGAEAIGKAKAILEEAISKAEGRS